MTNRIMKTERARERGAALLAALVILFLAVGVSAACIAASPLVVRDANERLGRTRARFLAMGAAERARAELNQGLVTSVVGGLTGLLGGTQPLLGSVVDVLPIDLLHTIQNAPDESAAATRTRQVDGSYLITAYGKAQGVTQGLCHVVRQAGTTTPFRWAAFGGSGVELEGDIATDSWSSDAGAYAGLTALLRGARGSLGSNGSIILDGGSVRGDARPGPTGSLARNGTTVSGSRLPSAAEIPLPPVRLDPPASDNNAALGFAVAGDGSLSVATGIVRVPSGVYRLSSLTASDDGIVEVTGDATIHLTGPLSTKDKGKLRIAHGASLKVYTTETVTFNGGGAENLTGPTVRPLLSSKSVTEGIPSRLQVFVAERSAGVGARVTLGSKTPLYAAIYAPSSLIRATRDVEVFGSLVSGSLELEGAKLHFDEALEGAPPSLGSPIAYGLVARWWLP